jgi:hypothetical protein
MVKAVPSRPTRVIPAARIACAVGSAMCSSGIATAACTCEASLCIVLVQISSRSAPAPSSLRGIGQPFGQLVPLACVLQRLDLGKIERPQQAARRSGGPRAPRAPALSRR